MRGGWAPSGAGPHGFPRSCGRPSARVLTPQGLQPVMLDSGLELTRRFLRSLGPGGGGNLGETCAALRVLGLRWGRFSPEPGFLGGIGKDRRGRESPSKVKVRLSPGSLAPDTRSGCLEGLLIKWVTRFNPTPILV